MKKIRKTIAQQMIRSVSHIPHVTHTDTVDVTEIENLRGHLNKHVEEIKRVTASAIIIRAVALTLRKDKHKHFNASVDMEAGEIVYKEYINIGIAVDIGAGLVVANIRGPDQLTVLEIAAKLAKIKEKKEKGKVAIEDLHGGTFTISNVGALGGMFSTPIINYPEVAILGLGKSRKMPVVHDGLVVVRTIMPISFSFDHRIADGADAARFCTDLLELLEEPLRLLTFQ